MKKKIGVYVCHCGGNISDYVDVEKVRLAVENDEGVCLAKTTMFACADSNQKEMANDIINEKLDGVVVASCSPKLHLLTFRAVTERAGLNKYNYVHANIREQVSWAHSDNKTGATDKAILIVKAAIAKVRFAESLDTIKIPATKAVAVIGAGVAGMRAAIEFAEAGMKVYLIEREQFVGGRVSQWDNLFTSEETGKDLVTRLYNEVDSHHLITLLTGAEVVENSGSVGDFRLKVQLTPRYITLKCNEGQLQDAIDVCPVIVPDEFNFNITKRKAIYHNYPSEYPHLPAIDIKNCTRCGECEKVCKNIDFSQKTEIMDLNVGSILMATGFDPYEPKKDEFGYGKYDNVVTLPQFKRIIHICDDKLVYNNKEIKNIAYIYCVGSRQVDGDNKYCSRYCCTAVIHSAITAKKKYKNINNYHFTRGIRTYGKQEVLFDEASTMGDIFLQSFEYDPPQIKKEGDKTIVSIKDILTMKKELSIDADLIVLVTGMVPRKDNAIGSLLKLPKGRDNFFNEIHMKLRPVETVIDGITIAGSCQGPKNITESMNSALSAATKSFSLINSGELALEPTVAKINKENCTWCGKCEDACPYTGAIIKVENEGKSIAEINPGVCKGCGMCLPVCPTDAIDLIGLTNEEVESMIDALIPAS
ncbi:MAG: CoB--CoM heterodisulfide reductase iron-sulfur subunit A family protein [Bacteroidales bacterium]|nr:CoB--CoM heterodisulfide reductase iron-sulfur subunit A family protein [Bacteroidales bacterium]